MFWRVPPDSAASLDLRHNAALRAARPAVHAAMRVSVPARGTVRCTRSADQAQRAALAAILGRARRALTARAAPRRPSAVGLRPLGSLAAAWPPAGSGATPASSARGDQCKERGERPRSGSSAARRDFPRQPARGGRRRARRVAAARRSRPRVVGAAAGAEAPSAGRSLPAARPARAISRPSGTIVVGRRLLQRRRRQGRRRRHGGGGGAARLLCRVEDRPLDGGGCRTARRRRSSGSTAATAAPAAAVWRVGLPALPKILRRARARARCSRTAGSRAAALARVRLGLLALAGLAHAAAGATAHRPAPLLVWLLKQYVVKLSPRHRRRRAQGHGGRPLRRARRPRRLRLWPTRRWGTRAAR